ncbi:MAG: hypothetical protein J1F38_05565 [Muribaculaceae bacterium]|nr:hypothetical protein [Muribaculaceae bacterium]
MKKLAFLCAGVVMLAMTSCKSNLWTATQVPVSNTVATCTVADLNVGNRVSYTYRPTSADRKGGLKNCKNAAIAALLKENGNADVLVAPEFNYDNTLTYITVSGRPATYKNFRSCPPVPMP